MSFSNLLTPNGYTLYCYDLVTSSSGTTYYTGNSPNYYSSGVTYTTMPAASTGSIVFQSGSGANGKCSYNALTGVLVFGVSGICTFVLSFRGSNTSVPGGQVTLNIQHNSSYVETTVITYPASTGNEGSASINGIVPVSSGDTLLVTYSNSGGTITPVANGIMFSAILS
jgi:hypothetical protein